MIYKTYTTSKNISCIEINIWKLELSETNQTHQWTWFLKFVERIFNTNIYYMVMYEGQKNTKESAAHAKGLQSFKLGACSSQQAV